MMDLRRTVLNYIVLLLLIELRVKAIENENTSILNGTNYNIYNYFTINGNWSTRNFTNGENKKESEVIPPSFSSEFDGDVIGVATGSNPLNVHVLSKEEIRELCRSNGFDETNTAVADTKITKESSRKPDIKWKPVPIPTSCLEVANGGIYNIQLASKELVSVLCESTWTVVQFRDKHAENFYRNINEYISGFGELKSEFWMGLELLHQLTSDRPHELNILLKDSKGTKKYAHYDNFKISDYVDGYKISSLGSYRGDAGDSLTSLMFQAFSANDADNDDSYYTNCAEVLRSGWWYKDCNTLVYSDVNGEFPGSSANTKGIVWSTLNQSLVYSKITIRPRS